MERPDTQARRARSSSPPFGGTMKAAARAQLVDKLNREARSMRYVDYDRLKELAEEAFEVACIRDEHGLQYSYGKAAARAMLADRACTLGDWSQTRTLATQALASLDNGTPSVALFDALEVAGWASFYTGDYVDALDHAERALKVAEQLGDKALQARALDRIANAHDSASHPDVAHEAHVRALELLEAVDEPLLEAVIRNNFAFTLMGVEKLDEALASAQASLDYCETHHCPFLHTGVYDTIATVHMRRGELDRAREDCLLGIELASDVGCDPDLTNTLLSLSRIEALEGNWTEALSSAERALELATTRGMGVERYQCHELISQIYEQQGNHQDALHHYRRFHQLFATRTNEEIASRLALLRVDHQVEAARKDAEILRLRSLALEQEVEERRIAQAQAEAAASLDALTGLFNRRHMPVLAERLSWALANGQACAVALLDIDYFKVLNDTYGHGAGDRMLRIVAGELSQSARRSDAVCRLGGDEFLVLFIDMAADAAHAATERVREAIASQHLDQGGASVAVTVSAGLACAPGGSRAALDTLIHTADMALYEAKRAGRDRLIVRDC